ncbi:MAG: copper resistance protein B [Gammaproteobacteria bacterium]|nr:copper resistance protein B [Gammaproteobacteria bacterium]
MTGVYYFRTWTTLSFCFYQRIYDTSSYAYTCALAYLATKAITPAEIGSGLNQMRYTERPYYRLMPGFNIFAEFESDQYYGSFKKIQKNNGNATSDNALTFGVSAVF